MLSATNLNQINSSKEIRDKMEDNYGFYCDLEEEPVYKYEVVEYDKCYKVIRKQVKNISIENIEIDKLDLEENADILSKKETNFYVLTLFVVSSIYLFCL